MNPRFIIQKEAERSGFQYVRFSQAHPAPRTQEFEAFIAQGHHGTMDYLSRGIEARRDLSCILPNVQTVAVLGMNYWHLAPPDPGGLTGRVSSYAWGRDYHNLAGKRLRKFVKRLQEEMPDIGMGWSLDTRPVLERGWAEQAGLGFVGKNCCSIVPGTTSYLFLATLFLDVEIPHDSPLGDHCGRCRQCLDRCPTNAFVGPHQLDARRCIAYLTIENRGDIPEHLRAEMGRWVFGCDECQDICPHNHAPDPSNEHEFAARPGHAFLDLEWVLRTDDDTLREHFNGSPIGRARPIGLKRNAAVVLGNLGDPAARPALLQALSHPSSIVQSHARWALERL